MTISFDDGAIEDLKAATLAEKHNVKAVFYIPVLWQEYNASQGRRSISLGELRDIAKKHEIGSHTISHRHLTKIPLEEAKAEIRDSKQMLEELLGVEIVKFCPPRGYMTPELIDYASEFYDSIRFTRGAELVHIHPDSGANENRPWRERVIDQTEELWGHSWEIEKFGLWEELDQFLGAQYENSLS